MSVFTLFTICILCKFVYFVFSFFFFFFKQKTAYEMRISDWSSDVCSSDLDRQRRRLGRGRRSGLGRDRHRDNRGRGDRTAHAIRQAGFATRYHGHIRLFSAVWSIRYRRCAYRAGARSEEHTSELQSLMRISYAVFCLKKKKNTTRTNPQPTSTA